MAGCFDSPLRVGSKARGTRSQFKLATDGLLPFKCTYPVHLTDVMDVVPSTQSDLRRGELISPIRGTRTRAVREYEETIEELRKENFDLKLRRFLLEETLQKHLQKNKGDDQTNTVQVVVELKVEVEALKRELHNKDQLLQGAFDQAEKYAADLNELQDRFVELQQELTSNVKIPLEKEWVQLKDEKENFEKECEYLRNVLSEKDKVIQNANAQIEELSDKIQVLEAKVNKRSLAIQGIVHKYYKDVEMIPKELRPIVQVAVQAAKECKEEELNAAIGELKASLCKIMPTSVQEVSYDQRQKENEDPSKTKTCVTELRKLPGASQSSGEFSQSSRQIDSKTKFVHVINEQSPTQVKTLSQSSESINESVKSLDSENFEEMMVVLKDNDHLKTDNEEKARTIKDLNTTCSELERRTIQLQSELSEAVSKVKKLEMKIREEKSKSISSLPKESSSVQSGVQCRLMESKLSDSFLQSVGQSDNVDELKEEILRLLLTIEQKDKEVFDIEQELGSLQSQFEKIDSQKNMFPNMDRDIDDFVERNYLHQRLALSCQVNQELMEHLRKLETFMEDLLQHKNLDSSSIENISGTSDVFSRLATCLDETKKLSTVLSDHLSVCESSKLFDPSDISMSREEYSQSDRQRYPEDPSRLSLNTSKTHSTSQGRNNFFQSESSKNTAGTGKRRLSFSTLHNATRVDSENVVVLGTSNNEDLILLLNDQGDPQDVLIRNNHSQVDRSAIDQLPRRCLDSSMGSWSQEQSSLVWWCASQMKGPKVVQNHCPSSDSDIWSEPDRDVSLQRIGIDVQKSPVTQKSPRRLRLRDKRTTDELSSQKNESSSCAVKLHPWLKRRKSGETLKSPFVCKKCLSHTPSKDESPEKDRLQKVVNDLSNKCNKQENELDEMNKILDNKIKEIDKLNKEKLELSSSINTLVKELNELKVKEKQFTLQSSESTGKLTEVSSENVKLRNSIELLGTKATESDSICKKLKEELEETKMRLQKLDMKCSKYESDLSSSTKTLEDYKEKYNNVEKEKDKVLSENQKLVSTKNALHQSIQLEKDRIEQLENENGELKKKLEEMSKSFTSLQSQNAEIETKSRELLREKENNLLSSNSTCVELKEQLKKSLESFKNVEQLCTTYENESHQSLEIKENVRKSLIKVKNLFLNNLQNLRDVCKQYLNCGDERFKDIDNYLTGRLFAIDNDDKIEELFTDISTANAKFKQTIKFLSDQLSSVSSIQQKLETNNKEIQSLEKQNSQLNAHIKTLQLKESESKSLVKESKSKIDFLQQDLGNAKVDIKALKGNMEEQQVYVKDIQQSLIDTEKYLEESKVMLSSSEMKVNSMQKQAEEDQNLLDLKDKQISELQMKALMAQAQLNEALSENRIVASQIRMNSSQHGTVSALDPSKGSPNVSNASETSVRQEVSSVRGSCENIATSINSITSAKDEESIKDTDKCIKKSKSSKIKLAVTEKQIEMLEKEKSELKEKLEEMSKSFTSLKSQNAELETKFSELLKGKESNLLSSNSICDELKEQLKESQESFESLKQLCTTYEKESHQSLEIKENVRESLLKVKNLFLDNLQNLRDVCKQYLNCEDEKFKDIDNYLSGRLLTIDYDNKTEELFADIYTANEKFEQTIEFLSDQLSSVSSIQQKFKMNNKEIQSLDKQNSQLNARIKTLQLKESESKSLIKDSKSKIEFLQQDLSSARNDIKELKGYMEGQQVYIEDIQQSLKDKEKSLEESKVMLSSSEMKLNSMQKQVDKDQNLLDLKDEKILELQKRALKAQTQLHEAVTENMIVASQIRVNSSQSLHGTVSALDPSKGSPNVSNASETSITQEFPCVRDSCESIVTSINSITSAKDEESIKNTDKYMKKIKSLKTKLVITEKRIEMLEKEKSDLREEFSTQVQRNRITSQSSEESDSLRKDLADLKEELQAKRSFIIDLKSDMFKTCNSLVDKQQEVNDLKRKLSDSKEVKSTSEEGLKFRYSDPLHTDTEANIKMLKRHKWELIQSILSQQQQFYERRNIHLGHFEKFKAHIEKLRAIQVSPTMFKSEPLLNSFTAESNCYAEKCDKTLKNLQVELELDVECLQNFKIFFKRFFIPLVLQSCEQCTKNIDSSPKHSLDGIEKSGPSPAKMLHESKILTNDPTLGGVRIASAEAVHHESDNSYNDRLTSTASVLARKIDSMESILKSVKPLLDNVKESSTVEETPKKIAAISLLVKLSENIGTLQDKTDEIFRLNGILKSFGLFDVPLSRSKQDMSDRDSLSEETITLSRSGSISPMSFEENLPFQSFRSKSERSKMPSSPHQQNEKSAKQHYSEPSRKSSNVAVGSQESICHRSHFSSPDLGIESDPNHESSAPEQAELRETVSRRHESGTKGKAQSVEKQVPESVHILTGSTKLQVSDHAIASGDALHAICILQHYELLKKEVQESLVGIKSVLSRTSEGMLHITKYTSPRKNLEYSTFKAIRDTSGNIEACLEEAKKLIYKFWIAPCPSTEEINNLIQQNQEQQKQLRNLEESKRKQECYFDEALAKLKHAEIIKENMERKISKKLVKTKKVIRQAEVKLLERRSQDLPHIPKYPSDEPTCQKKL